MKPLLLRIAIPAVLALALVAPVAAEDDALPIVQQAFEASKANEALLRRYMFRERQEERRFNKKGEVKQHGSRTYEVTLLDHSEVRRLVAIDDRPLPAKTEAKEQRKLEKRIEKMRSETPKQRRRRLAKVEQSRREGEKFLEEITRAFDFRRIGEETLDGVPTHVISAEPREGYEPGSREARVLTKLRGTLWIAEEDHAWVKAELETFDTIKWAFVFKLREGAKIRFRQSRINDEVWAPVSWYVRMRARAALVYSFNGEVTGTYSDYRRFTTDSTVILGETAP